MKVKDWLIHKLGGVLKEEIMPPIQYTIYRPKVETIKAEFVDRGVSMPQEYIEEKLSRNLMSIIKNYMKIEKNINSLGEKYYIATINIMQTKE